MGGKLGNQITNSCQRFLFLQRSPEAAMLGLAPEETIVFLFVLTFVVMDILYTHFIAMMLPTNNSPNYDKFQTHSAMVLTQPSREHGRF